MIHDSYGTLAADTDRLGSALRAAFVEMYQQHDVLGEFLAAQRRALPQGKFTTVPASGSLDISVVLDSEFFFA
jgi:DNA-directed RNA polymerase